MLKIKLGYKIIALLLCFTMLVTIIPTDVMGMLASALTTGEATSELGNSGEDKQETSAAKEQQILGEIKEKRDAYNKHFLTSDHTIIAAKFAEPVHYLKNGKWEEIDNSLVDLDGQNLENKENNFKIQFAKNAQSGKLVSMKNGEYDLTWSFESSKPSKVEKIDMKGKENLKLSAKDEKMGAKNIHSSVEYKNVYDKVDVRYTLKGDGVKEDILLTEKGDRNTFTYEFTTKNLTAKQEDAQTIVFYSEKGEAVYTFSAPVAYDANYESTVKMSLGLLETKKGYQITLTVDKEWLDSAERAYPVTIDPVVTTKRTIYGHWETYTYSYPGHAGWDYSTYEHTNVGKDITGHVMRTLIKFDGMPSISSADRIINAKLQLHAMLKVGNSYSDFYYGRNADVAVHQMTADWSNSSTWNSLWGANPNYGFDQNVMDYQVVSAVEAYQWDITKAAVDWYNDSSTNKGLMLKLVDPSVHPGKNCQVYFYSTDYLYRTDETDPYFIMEYRNANGIEDYWEYQTQDAGRAGTGYINNFNGNLVFTHNDFSKNTSINAFSINHVYNASLISTSKRMGKGWMLNVMARVEPSSIPGYPYVYIDGDGTKHYFDDAGDDEDGLGLKLTPHPNAWSDEYTDIKDKDGTVYVFDVWGYLRRMIDTNGNIIALNYGPDATENYLGNITCNGTLAVSFAYSGENLSSITDAAGRVTQYRYDPNNPYDNKKLTKIIYPDGSYTDFEYNGDLLIRAYEYGIGGQGKYLEYTYQSTHGANRIASALVKASGTSEQFGITSTQYGYNQTKFTYTDGSQVTCQFDHWGRMVSAYDDKGNATSSAFNSSGLLNNKLNEVGNYSFSSRNFLLDTTFKSDLGNWIIIGNSAYASVQSTGIISNRSAKISLSQSDLCVIAQTPSLPANKTYTFSAYIKTENVVSAQHGAAVEAIINTPTGIRGVYSDFLTGTTSVSSDDGFRRVSCTFTLAPGESLARVTTGLFNASGTAYINAPVLEEGEVANDYNLIPNESFDFITSGQPIFWNYSSMDLQYDGLTTADKRTGSYSMKIKGDPIATRHFHTGLDVQGNAGDVFHVGGWAKATSIPGKPFRIATAVLHNDSTVEWFDAEFNDAVTDWQYTSRIIKTSKPYFTIHVYIVYTENCNTAYFDDIHMIKGTAQSLGYDASGNTTSASGTSGQTQATYDDKNRIKTVQNPDGTTTTYDYYPNSNNLQKVVEGNNIASEYTYDTYGNKNSTTTYYNTAVQTEDYSDYYQVSTLIDDFSGSQSNWRRAGGGTPITTFMPIESDSGGNGKDASEVVKFPYTYNSYYDYFVGYHMSSTPTPDRPAPSVVKEATGISLWVRSNNATSLRLDFNTSYGTFSKTFSVNSNWQLVRIPFSEIGFNPLTASQYQNWFKIVIVSSTSQTGDIYVDDIAYYKGVAPSGQQYLSTPKSTTTSAEYNADGTLKSSTDDRGYKTSNTYHTSGHQKGLLSTTTAPNGLVMYYNYNNPSNRLTYLMAEIGAGVAGQVVVNYGYTGDNLTQITHNGFNYNFTYDSFGRMLETKVGNQALITNNYQAPNGQLSSSTYGNGHTQSFGYDSYGRVKSKYTSGGKEASYSYHKSGSLSKKYEANWGGGLSIVSSIFYDVSDRLIETVRVSSYLDRHTTRFTYDNKSRVSTVQNEIGSTSNTIEYLYAQNSSRMDGIKLNGTQQISYGYDKLERLQTRTLTAAGNYTTKYGYLSQAGKTTSMLSTLQNGNDVLSYTYDSMGNITEIYENGILQAKYTYDRLSQLIREDNKAESKTISYSYDKGGNILSKKEYAFTLAASLTGLSYTETGSYGYDTVWKDKLTSYNGQTITYDAIGNPLTYRDGMSFGWAEGRELAGITTASNSGWFVYNDEGMRTIKYFDTGSSVYYLDCSNIMREVRSNATGSDILDFFYDDGGNLFGFQYDNNKYYYIRNAQNDITGILDSDGGIVVSYEYDTWGKVLSVSGTLASTIGELNPFRYRGYYYDSETGLYYLQSRYYDPQTGRFLNADGILGANGDILSHNLFAYCSNNPVSRSDSTGNNWWDDLTKKAEKVWNDVTTAVNNSWNATTNLAATGCIICPSQVSNLAAATV